MPRGKLTDRTVQALRPDPIPSGRLLRPALAGLRRARVTGGAEVVGRHVPVPRSGAPGHHRAVSLCAARGRASAGEDRDEPGLPGDGPGGGESGHGLPQPAPEHRRDRVLAESEIGVLWKEFEAERPLVMASYKPRLLTARRGGEILGMRWEPDPLRVGLVDDPARDGENGTAHRMPLRQGPGNPRRDQAARRPGRGRSDTPMSHGSARAGLGRGWHRRARRRSPAPAWRSPG